MSRGIPQVVLVTGGSSGIGLATARHFAARGSRVVLVARNPDRLAAAADAIGPAAIPFPVDVTSDASLAELASTLREREGRLDLLVNAAGQLEIGRAETLGPEAVERLMRVNFFGAVHTIHALLPLLRAGTRPAIVSLSSLAGKLVPPYFGAYSASKFALTAYSHALRQELRSEGIHVGVVYPGPVETPMIADSLGTTHYPRPFGVPVLAAEAIAREIERCARRRLAEVVAPRRMGLLTRFGAAVPLAMDRFYRRHVLREERG